MSGRQSVACAEAMRLVAQGVTPYRAAKMTGIAFSTVYRALARLRRSGEVTTAPEPVETRGGPI